MIKQAALLLTLTLLSTACASQPHVTHEWTAAPVPQQAPQEVEVVWEEGNHRPHPEDLTAPMRLDYTSTNPKPKKLPVVR